MACFVDPEKTVLSELSDQICNCSKLLYCASYFDVTVFVTRTPVLEQTLQTLISWSLRTGWPGPAVVADRISFISVLV